MSTTEFYIGLMSGTSIDGIDAVLVDFHNQAPFVITSKYIPYPEKLREQILSLCIKGEDEIRRLGELDIQLGKEFAKAVTQLIAHEKLTPEKILGIGSHGQTIRHAPYSKHAFTLQIGDPNIIAAETGITTVADFRRKDMAYGGQGAPLVPAFHQAMFASDKMNRAIVNIGGIANVTLLPKHSQVVTGFDTGPGNVLLDEWIRIHQQNTYDKNGQWAQQGFMQNSLLQKLLADPYFLVPPPKSTGREYFNLSWLRQFFDKEISPIDIQATLIELTAQSICKAIHKSFSQGEIFVCGGGAHNQYLMQRLCEINKGKFNVTTTHEAGIDPDYVEAVAFAWLARQTLNRKTGNLPSVTGATKAGVLGGIYYA